MPAHDGWLLPRVADVARTAAAFGDPDPAYAAFARATAGSPDLGRADHRLALLRWLNAWGCRIRYPRAGEPDLFDGEVGEWWAAWGRRLPPVRARLAGLGDRQIERLVGAYADLLVRPVAAAGRPGGVRSLGPTATAKALWVMRPHAAMAWDARIAQRLYGGRDPDAYRRHLRQARDAARALVSEAGSERRLLDAAGRPDGSVAKLLDEYWFITVSSPR